MAREPVNVIALMEDINEKLKLLNYENDFLKKRTDLRPVTRTFFAISSKASEQFPYFSQLVAWLLHLIGVEFMEWNEFDDPNTISQAIVDELRKLGMGQGTAGGVEQLVPVSKLRHGSGDAVCLCLDFLADRALASRRFRVQPPIYNNNDDMEEAQVDEAAEIGDEVEEDVAQEEEMLPGLSGPNDFASDSLSSSSSNAGASGAAGGGGGGDESWQSSTLSANNKASVDPAAWRLELERVGPLLKLRSSATVSAAAHGGKEWRSHLEAAVKHVSTIKSDFPLAETALRKQAEQLRKAVERVQTKERQVNKEFEHLGGEFKQRQKQLDDVQDKYNALSASVAELTADLQKRMSEVEEIKQSMTDRNNSMTDTTPLRKISNSLNTLKEEVKQMELRIGVVGQTLLQAKVRHQHHQQQMQTSNAHNTPGASLKATQHPLTNSRHRRPGGRDDD